MKPTDLQFYIPKLKDRVTDGTRQGTVIKVGEQVSEIKFDKGYIEYVSNRWLKPYDQQTDRPK